MQIEHVVIQNFLTIGEATINLADRGLVLIQGENRDDPSADSNGAGKSSVVEAVCWALYGVTARDVTGDAVINDKAKKNCSVQVSITDGGERFVVLRTRKGPKGNQLLLDRVEADGSMTSLTKGTEKETQAVIEQIVGCSRDVFCAAAYAGQEAMPDLPGMTDKQLKLLVEEGAGIETLAKAYQHARTMLTQAQAQVQAHASKVQTQKNNVVAAEARLVQSQKDHDDWAVARKARATELAEWAKAKKELWGELTKKLEAMNKDALQNELAGLKQQADEIGAQNAKRADMQTAATKADKLLTLAMANVNVAKNKAEAAKNEAQNVHARIGKPCPACGKPQEEHDLEQIVQHAKQAQTDAMNELLAAVANAKPLKDAKLAADEALQTFVAGMTDPTALLRRQTELNDGLRQISDVEQTIARTAAACKDFANQAVAKMAETNPHAAAITRETAGIEKLKLELAEMETADEALRHSLTQLEDAVTVFGPAGVRAHVLDTVTPFLNEKTSEYLGTLSDGAITAAWSTLSKTAKGELREKFVIDVSHAKGGKSFASLSGGEKRKVRLACAMALQDMVATRATKPINLFIADEVDHALDESGLERLMSVLERKARDRGTVLVISHNSLSDWIDNVMTVVKEGDISRVEGATNG